MEFDLVFEGGGAKGSVFVGALQAFEEREHTARRLIGTSAGAITATLMAAGYRSGDLYDAVTKPTSDRKPQFSAFMDVPEKAQLEERGLDRSLSYAILKSADLSLVTDKMPDLSGLSDKMPGLSWLSGRTPDLSRVSDAAADLIDRSIFEPLMAVGAYRQSFSLIERGGLFAGEAFRAWLTERLNDRDSKYDKDPDDPEDRPLGEATLRSFYARTESDLSLVASDLESRKMLVLNHRTAPDCPVAWAARMSMSIPFLWQEVVWRDSEFGHYRGKSLEGHTIVDGGVLSNFPIELLTSRDQEDLAIMGDEGPAAVPNLGLLIDETLEVEGADDASDKRDDEGKEGGSLLDDLTRGTVERIRRLVDTITNTHDAPAIREHAAEICRLPAKGYGTTEFDMSEERLDALVRAGKKAMEEYLDGLTDDESQDDE